MDILSAWQLTNARSVLAIVTVHEIEAPDL